MVTMTAAAMDRTVEQARQVRFWRTVATVIAGVLYGAGWLAFHATAGVWFALVWSVGAVRLGWTDARNRGRQ